ncbi:MAG: response regulator transcription factor [Bacillota bacterium]
MGEFRVLLSSRSPQWSNSLAAAFLENSVFDVVGTVLSPELTEKAGELHPDIVLWKIEDEDPVPVLNELRLKCPFILPVILVDDPKRLELIELLRAGVRGCLPLRLLPRQIVQAVELIVKAGMLCLPRLGAEFFYQGRKENERVILDSLTGREREVLFLLGKNLSNQEIGRTLYLSESTVKTHLRSIFRKLGVRNRAEALVAALRLGVLEQKDVISGNY